MKMPRLYLGTMTFGWSQTSSKVDESIASAMLEKFAQTTAAASSGGGDAAAVVHLDTARIYAGGKTEQIVGNVLSKTKMDNNILVGTKAHPSRKGGLSAAGIQGQWQESLDALKVSAVHEYYLHQPDTEHSLEESLRAVNQLVEQGLVKVIGLSNYHASEVARAFALCAQNGWKAPQVYQGLYNPLNRAVEQDLLPLLRQHDCSFVAYNPLAAGLLTGKHTTLDQVQKGRFQNNPNYLPRFYTPSNFQALDIISQACEEANLSMVQATYRWLQCHSALTETDGILLGASSLEQLDQNLASCCDNTQDPLPDKVVKAFEQAWDITRQAGVFPYWRSYSADMPGRESLDPGASYEAAKK